MAHFAKIENGKVVNCIVVRNEDCGGGDFPESEDIGKAFIASLGFDGDWVQTSYNKNFRGCYAGLGMNWNGTCFYSDSPFPSWALDESTGQWKAPIPRPEDGKAYNWDEQTLSWTEVIA